MRPAAFVVIGVRAVDADFLDMIRISSCVATSATGRIVEVGRRRVFRAVRQGFQKNAQGEWSAFFERHADQSLDIYTEVSNLIAAEIFV